MLFLDSFLTIVCRSSPYDPLDCASSPLLCSPIHLCVCVNEDTARLLFFLGWRKAPFYSWCVAESLEASGCDCEREVLPLHSLSQWGPPTKFTFLFFFSLMNGLDWRQTPTGDFLPLLSALFACLQGISCRLRPPTPLFGMSAGFIGSMFQWPEVNDGGCFFISAPDPLPNSPTSPIPKRSNADFRGQTVWQKGPKYP